MIRVKIRAGGVVAVLVHGQDHGDLAYGVIIPGGFRAIRPDVLFTIFVRRIVQSGFVEESFVVVHHRRVNAEGNAQLAFAASFIEVYSAFVVLGQVIAGFLDERGQVQPLPVEGFCAVDAHGADDIGRVARSQFRGQCIEGGSIGDDLGGQVDVGMGGIELIDHFLLSRQLIGVGAGAQADEPADFNLTGFEGRGGGGGCRIGGGCPFRGGGSGGSGGCRCGAG